MQTAAGFLCSISFFLGAAPARALPNPAATFCTSVDGETHAVASPLGEVGLCILGAASIEQWTLFRHASGVFSQAVQVYRSHPASYSAAPSDGADAYCTQVGGSPSTLSDSRGAAVALCTFPDNSAIAQKTLYDGPHGQGHARFNTVLEKYLQR